MRWTSYTWCGMWVGLLGVAACGSSDAASMDAGPLADGGMLDAGEGGGGGGGDAGDEEDAAAEAGPDGDVDAGGDGGGEPISLLPEFASGSRLKVRQYQHGDMPPVFVSFFDASRDEDCSFEMAADGALRCMPATRGVSVDAVYADAECQRPAVGEYGPCRDAARYHVELDDHDGNPCTPQRHHLFPLVQLDQGAPLYVDEDGTCVEQGSVPDPTEADALWYFRVDEELSPSTFVAGERTVAAAPDRLSIRRLEAEDGAYRFTSIYDTTLEGDCRTFEADSFSVCIAHYAFHPRGYRAADPSCEQSLVEQRACEPPPEVVVRTPDGTGFAAVGDAHEGTVYEGLGNMCTEVSTDRTFYAVGQTLDPEELPVLSETQAGSGRLRGHVTRDAQGNALTTSQRGAAQTPGARRLHDDDLDVSCAPERMPDGDVYCVPASVPVESHNNLYYADADCTQQLAHCDDTGCPQDIALLQIEDACPDDPSAYEAVLALGEPYGGEELYIFYGGREPGMQCDGPFDSSDYGVLRRVTGSGALDALASLDEVVD